jgi:predicted phage-related endonuclease
MDMQTWIVDDSTHRRSFIGGSDARIIMGDDENALLRLWREKRGEVEPEDLSSNLTVQLGTVTENLNRRWWKRTGGRRQVSNPSTWRASFGWKPTRSTLLQMSWATTARSPERRTK